MEGHDHPHGISCADDITAITVCLAMATESGYRGRIGLGVRTHDGVQSKWHVFPQSAEGARLLANELLELADLADADVNAELGEITGAE